MRRAITRGVLILGFAVSALGQQPEFSLQVPNGVTALNPGQQITIEVFVDGISSPTFLRAYQATIAITPQPGATGSLGLVDPITPDPGNESIFVATTRADWVFFGAPSGAFGAANVSKLAISATLIVAGDSVSVSSPMYCGTYVFVASPDALGDFTIDFLLVDPQAPESLPTQMLDGIGFQIQFVTAPVGGVTVNVSNVNAADDCVNAASISDGVTAFSTLNTTTDGPGHPGSGCDQAGTNTVSNDIWYDYTASCSGILSVSTCGTANFDTRVAVYDTLVCECPVTDADLLVCNDDASGCAGSTSEAVISGVAAGDCYKIRVGGTGDVSGTGDITITCTGNDACPGAEAIALGATVRGSTRNTVLNDGAAPDCGTGSVDSPGVWYSVLGTGDRITASLCSGTSYDSRLTVYEDTCGALSCVADADDTCGLQETVSWCSTLGTQYLVLVHGAGGALGDFTLRATNASCNDGNACTDDSCGGGVCSNVNNYDDTTECCNPMTGGTEFIDDINPCTTDVCDPGTGVVSHQPVPDGPNVECDDGGSCTLDECQGGVCSNSDINSMTCNNNSDCPAEFTCGDGSGGSTNGLCFCDLTTPLTLVPEQGTLPVKGCFSVGDTMLVRVEMGLADDPVVGAQFFVEYDASAIVLLNVHPGSSVDPGSPFALEFNETVDPVAGTLDYMVGANFGQSTQGPETVAALEFLVLAECSAFVRFRPSGPNGVPNRLTDNRGGEVVAHTIDMAPLTINGTPPVLSSCPSDILTGPDFGVLTAVITWAMPSATDSCDGAGASVVCSPPSGMLFLAGTRLVTCTATNSCGVVDDSCTFTVTVEPPVLTVDVELSSTMAPGPVDKCITFEVWDCNGPPGLSPVPVEQTVSFSNGLAQNVTVPLPGGGWDCLTARDGLHTLRSTAPDFTTPDGFQYTASFVGSRASGGHWLVGGNLNDDEFIDILDFGVFFPQNLTQATPDSACGALAPDGNVNGDNVIDLLDLVFVSGNSLRAAEPNCCGTGSTASASGPITSITVRELYHLGLESMIVADVNMDGVLDMDDMREFFSGEIMNPGDGAGSLRDSLGGKLGKSHRRGRPRR